MPSILTQELSSRKSLHEESNCTSVMQGTSSLTVTGRVECEKHPDEGGAHVYPAGGAGSAQDEPGFGGVVLRDVRVGQCRTARRRRAEPDRRRLRCLHPDRGM